jgi:hypothetical protein
MSFGATVRFCRSGLIIVTVLATGALAASIGVGPVGPAGAAMPVHADRLRIANARVYQAIGGGALPASAVSRVVWHRLALINGWRSANSPYGTGNPSYAVRHGIVYLAGSVRQPRGTNNVLAVLPRGARPSHQVELTVEEAGSPGFLSICPCGDLAVWTRPGNKNARRLTSLAAISFPAASTKLHYLTLLNGWNPGDSLGDSPPAYAMVDGVLHLTGGMNMTPQPSVNAFTVLPKAIRPWFGTAAAINIPDQNYYYQSPGTLTFFPDGEAFAGGPYSQSISELGGVSLPVAKFAWHRLKPLNGWTWLRVYGDGAPSYSVTRGIVYLSGGVEFLSATAPGSGPIAILPTAARPAHNLYIPLDNVSATTSVVTLLIEPNGKMFIRHIPVTSTYKEESLAGISYPLGS